MVSFIPWRAIPAIVAERITIPWDIMRFLGTVCRSIKIWQKETRGAYSFGFSFALHSPLSTVSIFFTNEIFSRLYGIMV